MDKGELALRAVFQLLRRLAQKGLLTDDEKGLIIGNALGAQDEIDTMEFNMRVKKIEALMEAPID